MGTVPEPVPGKEPQIKVFIDRVEEATRVLVAGSEVGAIRRIALYAIVAVALWGGQVLPPLTFIGAVALVLLVATDDLR